MNVSQVILLLISSMLFTVGLVYLAQSIFIYRRIDKYFYFSIGSMGVAITVFFEFLATYMGLTDQTYLLYHRLRVVGIMIAVSFWSACVFEISYNESKISRIFILYSLIIGFTIPTDYFLSLPVKFISVDFLGVNFKYHFATPHILYRFYFITVFIYYSYYMIKSFRRKMALERKIFRWATGIQILANINDALIINGVIKSIFLTEYTVFGFVIGAFIYFIVEGKRNNEIIIDTNSFLQDEVDRKKKELSLANDKLYRMATYDSLTGFYNRQVILTRLEEEKARIDRHSSEIVKTFVIFFIDLDNFKYYNDNFGHDVGDFVLKRFSDFIREQLRKPDLVARYGGDEFIVFLPATDLEGGEILIKRMYSHLKDINYFADDILKFIDDKSIKEFKLPVTFSTGIVEYVKDKSIDDILKKADEALYRVKNNSKGNYEIVKI